MNEKLFRPEFHQMETAEKQALMERLAARYTMAFLGLHTFDLWGQSCTTGVFEKDGREFVFVPGDTVTLGWDHFAAGLDPDSREELDELFREWEIEQSPEALIRESMAPVRQATIGPMLVGRKLEELCWEPVKMNDPRVTAHPDWLKKFRDFAWSDLESLTLHQSARIERMKSGFQIWIYNRTDYDTLLAGLEQQGFSLPTADEWAYLCGGGCRTLFPWGDGMDYSMHLHHFESLEDEDKPFDMEGPNFFGLSIAYDPYMREVVKAEQFTTCGGDGGRSICGGLGIFLGFLPCSPHCKPEVQEDKELNGDYDFYRPMIRVEMDGQTGGIPLEKKNLSCPSPCAFERGGNGVFQQIKDWKPEQTKEEQAMDILKQCQKWHEEDKFQKIIDALEAIPAEERTPEMDSELARAYNNLADPHKPGGRDLLKKAIALLKPHEEYFEGDHCWNFRMGYAYYYLDQEGRALRYFEKALEARPGDEDTKVFIEWCRKGISLPQFSECFRERTESAWEAFAKMESELRQMMDDDKDHTRGAEIVAQMEEALNLVFDEISFEMGFNGEKHELILTPEGDRVKLFELVYFQKHAPKEVLEHWNILVGRQPSQNTGLRTEDGWDISGEDVQIWLEEQGENSFVLSAYCEKLLPVLREAEGQVWWMLTTLTDQVLGEIPHMRYIDSFDVLDQPKAEPSFPLSQLPDKLKDKGLDLSCDPEGYLESYLSYRLEPNEDPDADWRLDTIVGSTCCVPLINGYLNADNDFMDDLHADGAVAGFFCYPLDTLREEEGSEKIFDFRDKLEEVFTTGNGPEILTLTGGATGLFCGYVDFIAWDIRAVLQKAKEFFEGTDIPWASFHTFRREAGTVALKKPPEKEPEDEDAPAVIRQCQDEIDKQTETADEDESDTDRTGVFTGFVLLSKGEWDKQQFIRDMQEKWGITVDEYSASEEKDDDALVFEVGDMLAAVSLADCPIPDGEAEANAENNYMWEDAVKVAREHRAHILVAVLGKEKDLLEKGKLFTKVVAVCCRQKYATGVYTSGVVFEPQFYEGFADMLKGDKLPIFNWIWFGLWRNEKGLNGYTYGMEAFGKDEMEVLDTDADPYDLLDFLASLASYVLENDVELHDGETIGFTADDKRAITRSPGVGLPEEQMTLKISWEPGGDPDGSSENDPDGERPVK